jgi:eukaryotic-like serine/threonine-protein kinase
MSTAEILDMGTTPMQDPLLGALIDGRFRVMATIGEGGMGKVYEALHEGLGRVVAIKVLGAAWASDEASILRFQREARTASNIGHRAIVDVSDLGRLDDGRPYLVMERLRGASLADLLDEHGRLPPDRVAHLITEVASALDEVHARGIVHRDIKPDNVMVVPGEQGGPEQVKLLDFGLAAFALPSAENARLTRIGQINGTPHYMAPESGEEAMPDYRADVYSMAVVAYELLTGFVPFDSKNPMQILTRKMHEDPPSMQYLSGLEFSEHVEQVMARGLARLPDERPGSAGEFACDLAEAIRSLPYDKLIISGIQPRVTDFRGSDFETQEQSRPLPLLSSKPPPPLDTAPAFPSRSRKVMRVARGGVVLLAGVGGLVYMTSGEEAAIVPASTNMASAAAAESGASGDDGSLAVSAPALPWFEVAAVDTAHDGESASEQSEALEGRGRAEAAKRAPGVDTTTARPQRRARRRPEPASPSAPIRAEPKEAPPSLASSDRERSQQLSREGTSALVQGRLPEAISIFRGATMAHTGNAVAWRGLGLANERLGRHPEAIQSYQRYLRLAPGARDADSVRQRVNNLGGSP